jgi:hypothetical protein
MRDCVSSDVLSLSTKNYNVISNDVLAIATVAGKRGLFGIGILTYVMNRKLERGYGEFFGDAMTVTTFMTLSAGRLVSPGLHAAQDEDRIEPGQPREKGWWEQHSARRRGKDETSRKRIEKWTDGD